MACTGRVFFHTVACTTRPTPPSRTKVRPIDLKKAIRKAQMFHPKSPEYARAWDEVEELSSELARQMIEKADTAGELCVEDPPACREYDV